MTEQEKFMREALKEAKRAERCDEVPIGAVIVLNNKIIARAHNRREEKNDATAHAEILAIQKACKKVGDFRLLGAEIYITLEPCLMCLGAILNARIDKIYVGALNNKENAVKTDELISRAELNHKCEFIPLLSEECSKVLSGYFLDKRKG